MHHQQQSLHHYVPGNPRAHTIVHGIASDRQLPRQRVNNERMGNMDLSEAKWSW